MVGYHYYSAQWRYRYTIFADQMFGSGKSRLGQELVIQATKHKQKIENILIERYKDDQLSYVLMVFHKFLESKTVRLEAIGDEVFSVQKLRECIEPNSKSGSVLLHIDELNGKSNKFVRTLWQNAIAIQQEYFGKDIYVYLYISGKQTLMNIVGLGSGNSPAIVYWCLLNPLKKEHLRDLVEYLQNQDVTIIDSDYFAERLHLFTGGVPRLVEFVFTLLVKSHAKLETKDDIDYVLDTIIFNYIKNNAPDSQKFEIIDEDLQRVAVAFLLAAQMRIDIKLKDKFNPTGKKKYSGMQAHEWLMRLPLYISASNEEETFQIIKSSYIYRLLKPSLGHWTVFKYLNKFEDQDSSIFDLGVFLEMVLSFLLLYLGENGLKMPFYFLRTTALKDFHEPIRFERQILLPQVTSRKEKVFDITEQNIMTINELKTVNPKQFSELIGKIKGNTFCPVRAKSNSADLYIILEKNGRPVEQAYQFKATDDIGFYNLSEELEKATFSENEGLHLFIVMALGYSKEITAHMDDSIDFMVLKSGIYFNIENGLLLHVSNNLKPLSFIKNGKELPIREANENQDLSKQKNLFQIYGKYYMVEDIEIAGKARHAIRDGSLFCDKNLKLNISDQVECLLIGPKLLKEFMGESNWDDLLKIRNGTQKDKLLILESQVSKRSRKGDLERDSPSKKFSMFD
jgi:hypothetical protein